MAELRRLGTLDYVAGLQCLRRLWLSTHSPELAEPRTPQLELLLSASAELAAHARALFPGGVAVAAGDPAAPERTRELLDDPAVPAIFDAVIQTPELRVRLDVLERTATHEWGLRCVKSSLRVKDEHLDELAFQLWALRCAKLEVGHAEVIHPDEDFVRGEGEPDWRAALRRTDATRDALFLSEDVAEQVEQMRGALALVGQPPIEPSPHCKRPYPCRFWSHCVGEQPEDWIGHLPGLRPQSFHALRETGAQRVGDIPDDFPLTRAQRQARSAILSGATVTGPTLARDLAGLVPPFDCLDFEAIMPELPLYPGTRPYQTIPFQWSLHRVRPDGSSHEFFLADGDRDPRPEFAERLCRALAAHKSPILVYSGFEATVIEELAAAFPERSAALLSIRARLRDLLPIVRNGIYAPRFAGSFSLKRVAPTLASGFGYGDLEGIADGGQAASTYLRIVRRELTPAQEAQMRAQLLAYCERDTQALCVLQRALAEHCR